MLGKREDWRRLIVLVDEVVVDAVLGHVDDARLQRRVDFAERHMHDLRAVGREGFILGYGRLHAHLDALEVGDLFNRLFAVHVPQTLAAQPNQVRAFHLGGIKLFHRWDHFGIGKHFDGMPFVAENKVDRKHAGFGLRRRCVRGRSNTKSISPVCTFCSVCASVPSCAPGY